MKNTISILLIFLTACTVNNEPITQESPAITGTWELIASQKIQQGDTQYDDLSGKRMIKVINETHFAFLNHDLQAEVDTLNFFVSGGGRYTLTGDQYHEYLDYCNYREWEGHEFEFTVSFQGDTLIQRGIEKVEELNVDREIIEKYIRTKD